MKVISIRGEEILLPGVPNDKLITDIQELLEKAKSGEISGLAWASLHRDDATSYGWNGKLTRGVIGALELVKYELMEANK